MGGPFPNKQLPGILVAIKSKCYNWTIPYLTRRATSLLVKEGIPSLIGGSWPGREKPPWPPTFSGVGRGNQRTWLEHTSDFRANFWSNQLLEHKTIIRSGTNVDGRAARQTQEALGVKKLRSSLYHTQGDGHAKRSIQSVQQTLR